MADSMCGPSNAAKGLVAHANRDRSIHQDRFVHNPAQSSTNFRSQTAFSQGNPEAEFQAFQSGMAPQAISNMGGIDPMQFAGPSHFNQNASFMPQPVYPNTSMNSTLASEYRQFMSSRQQPSLVQPTVANRMNQQVAGVTNQMSQLNMSSIPQQSFLYSSYSPMAYDDSSFAPTTYGGFGGSMQYSQAPGQPMAADFAQMATNQIDDEAFERAFGEIEGATENDQDFNAAMNDWMQRHGPAAEAQAAEVNANLEQLAQEQALQDQQTNAPTVDSQAEAERQAEQEAISKRREQEDLVRAASDIIDSIKDNQSEKFKKSSFIDLMRRIRAKEVVVEANALVDSESGTVIVSRPHDEMDDNDHSEGPPESKSEGKKVADVNAGIRAG